jgi:hypothetical protein
MKLDMILAVRSVAEAAGIAKTAEELGSDGLWSIETQHDPFLPVGRWGNSRCIRGSYRLSRGAALLLMTVLSLGSCTSNPSSTQEAIMNNRKVVDNFFVALETQKFELL